MQGFFRLFFFIFVLLSKISLESTSKHFDHIMYWLPVWELCYSRDLRAARVPKSVYHVKGRMKDVSQEIPSG